MCRRLLKDRFRINLSIGWSQSYTHCEHWHSAQGPSGSSSGRTVTDRLDIARDRFEQSRQRASMMITRCLVSSFAIVMLLWTTQARADDVNAAAKAFSQAQEAMLGGDSARAADLYELADELAPSAP